MWAGPDEREAPTRGFRAEVAAEAARPAGWAELPSFADARHAVAVAIREARSLGGQPLVSALPSGAIREAASAAAAQVGTAVAAVAAASPSRFASPQAADSRQAAAAT